MVPTFGRLILCWPKNLSLQLLVFKPSVGFSLLLHYVELLRLDNAPRVQEVTAEACGCAARDVDGNLLNPTVPPPPTNPAPTPGAVAPPPTPPPVPPPTVAPVVPPTLPPVTPPTLPPVTPPTPAPASGSEKYVRGL
mmetsp:Transcript_4076/g.7515  ORF Transcript_4076/g.7515 Transcript_4076/m.7515 type:complete len:137 (+) Transcript_4076:515-925(+)